MNKCYLCGITEEETFLYKGIHKEIGFVGVCRKCYFKDRMPLIEDKEVDWEKVNKRVTVRDRLTRMAKLEVVEKEEVKPVKINPEDIGLKNLVEKNVEKEISEGVKEPEDLIDNFHWVIMRKRRSMKLSRSELADKVLEQPVIIESLEKGVLPRDYILLVKKIENSLGVRLFKEKKRIIVPEELAVESKIPSGTLISELKENAKKRDLFFEDKKPSQDEINPEDINLEKIEEISGVPEEVPKKEKKNLDELSDEDINDLIWGKN